jgi:DNA-binding transcriptional ArsR family regulator
MQTPVDLDDAFRALAHRDRRRLMMLIGDGERSVGELCRRADLDQPIASQHLRVLRDAALVTVRVDGNRRMYSVDVDRIAPMRAFLDAFWRAKLGDLGRAAERREAQR